MPTEDLALGCLVAGLDVRYAGCSATTPVSGLEVDSRRVRPGQAFLAVVGGTTDGHQFIAGAISRGASVVLVQEDRGVRPTHPHVVLENTWRACATLAAHAWGDPASTLRLAAITGTNGKTTCAHLVGAILSAAGCRHLRLGTTGYWIVDREEPAPHTTPFPLELHRLLRLGVEAMAADGVMEVSSHALAQGRVDGIRFRVAALTSFSQDHLDYHASLADYQAAKCRLPSHHLVDGGWVIAHANGGDAAAAFLEAGRQAGARLCTLSADPAVGADVVVRKVDQTPDGLRLGLETPRGPMTLTSPMVGAFNVENILVAVAVGMALEQSSGAIATGIARCAGAPGRMERVKVLGGQLPTVFVDYAHTPDAVARVIRTLRSLGGGRVIVVLGCGGDRDRDKRSQMGSIAAGEADTLWATSDNPRGEDPDAILDDMLAHLRPGSDVVREPDRKQAIAGAVLQAAPEDMVLVAGKGHETHQIVGGQSLPFDDREVARDALLRHPARRG